LIRIPVAADVERRGNEDFLVGANAGGERMEEVTPSFAAKHRQDVAVSHHLALSSLAHGVFAFFAPLWPHHKKLSIWLFQQESAATMQTSYGHPITRF
jgi:hypothetical protein